MPITRPGVATIRVVGWQARCSSAFRGGGGGVGFIWARAGGTMPAGRPTIYIRQRCVTLTINERHSFHSSVKNSRPDRTGCRPCRHRFRPRTASRSFIMHAVHSTHSTQYTTIQRALSTTTFCYQMSTLPGEWEPWLPVEEKCL